MHVGGEFLVLKQFQEAVAELVGLDGGDPDSEITFYINNVFDQGLEVGVTIAITSHIDACEYDLLETMVNHFLDVFIDVLGGTAGGSSPDHRDDTVGAEIVASVVDLDEASGMEGVEGRLVAEQVAVVALWIAVT